MGLIRNYPVKTYYDYVIELPLSYYEENRTEIITWLVDNFGYNEDGGLWFVYEPEYFQVVYISFIKERDSMAFKLRWL